MTKFFTLNAAMAALVVSVGIASAGTFSFADAVPVQDGFDPQNATLTKTALDFEFDASFDISAFGGNVSDQLCRDSVGNLVYENGRGFNGTRDCGRTTSVTRSDGGTFSVSSVDIEALDNARYAGEGPGPQEADFADFDTWSEARFAWAFEGVPTQEQTNRFWVAGSRDGAEVTRLKFSAVQSQSSLLRLEGFDGIDQLTFGVDEGGPSDFIDDFFLVIASATSQGHCFATCETITLRGFDFALNEVTSNADQVAIAPVPLPAGLPMLLAGLGLMFGLRRRA